MPSQICLWLTACLGVVAVSIGVSGDVLTINGSVAAHGECLTVTGLCAVPHSSTVLSAAGDGRLVVFDAKDQRVIQTEQLIPPSLRNEIPPLRIAVSSDGRSAAYCLWGYRKNSGILRTEYRSVYIIDLKTMKRECILSEDGSRISAMAFSPDGQTLALGDDGVELLDIRTKTTRFLGIVGLQKKVTRVQFSNDGATLFSGGLDGTIAVWDVKSGKFVKRWKVGELGVLALAVSPDGQSLAANSGHRVRVLELSTQRILSEWDVAADGLVLAVTWLNNGWLCASAATKTGGRVYLFKCGSKEVIQTVGFGLGIWALAAVRNAGVVVAGDSQGVLHVLRCDTASMPGHITATQPVGEEEQRAIPDR